MIQPDEKDKQLIRMLQENLPLDERPFRALAERAGMSEDEVIEKISGWKRDGVVRRFGALVAHRKAGFSANGMVVWDVPDEQIEEAGKKFSAHPSVSHCYARPTFEGWPFRLYTMVHGHSREEVEKTARELSGTFGGAKFIILYSTREFKKSDSRLFFEQ